MSDRSRLPKWAQREIETLEMRLREAGEEVVKAREAAGFRKDREFTHLAPIEQHAWVEFTLDSGDQVEVRVAPDTGKLRIRANAALVIQPRVTNSIDLDVKGMF